MATVVQRRPYTVDLLAPRVWRPIVGFPDYEVSDCGQIRNRVTGRVRRVHIKSRQRPNQKARSCFQLRLTNNGPQLMVHQLVCEAFHGPRPSPAHEVAHRNGDSRDNRADNVRWATRTENEADKKLHGTFSPPPQHIGEAQHNSKLSQEDVQEIRRLYATGKYTQRALAEIFGVGRTNVTWIVNGGSWRHAL